MSPQLPTRLPACRNRLRRGAITLIAQLTGRNVHTVRLWVNHGEPVASKLSDTERSALRRCIEACIVTSEGV